MSVDGVGNNGRSSTGRDRLGVCGTVCQHCEDPGVRNGTSRKLGVKPKSGRGNRILHDQDGSGSASGPSLGVVHGERGSGSTTGNCGCGCYGSTGTSSKDSGTITKGGRGSEGQGSSRDRRTGNRQVRSGYGVNRTATANDGSTGSSASSC